MIEIGDFALLRPLWLLAPPALAVLVAMTRRRDALGDWRRIVDPALLAIMLRRSASAGASRSDAPLFFSVALISLALCGPAMKMRGAEQFRNLDATLILLDVSRAERLGQAVAAAQFLLERSGARQIGLALYAGDAYLASPLTDDAKSLESLLFAIDERTVPDGGTKPDRALAFARRLLREADIAAADIAIISDGEGLDPRAERLAAALAREGRHVHSLFVSARGGADALEPVRRAAMAALAAAGSGRAGDAADPAEIARAIEARGVAHIAEGELRALEWRDYGRFILLLAAAPLLLALRGRGA
ncbi:vWA domain-containing protein [Methylosinus sp. LW4]|uniref:vWA domain-containing protein n=1 Tax=Methylosinus sp. LW4 TaxID=136993 RepID=UPI00037E9741|nr:VWA domain-containing protein [Methylosinus sp. LW4]